MERHNEPLVLRTDKSSVCTLYLNAPKRANSLCPEMIRSLRTELKKIDENNDTRVVIITGKGKHFCSGHVISSLNGESLKKCSALMMHLKNLSVPVIAAVNGAAYGIGMAVVASCDFAYASKSAKFCFPGTNLGVFCFTPSVAAFRAMPARAVTELLFTGEAITAERAHEINIVGKVFEDNILLNEVTHIAIRISYTPRHILVDGKRFIRQQSNLPLSQAYEKGVEIMTAGIEHPIGQQGILAFASKRPSPWVKQREIDSILELAKTNGIAIVGISRKTSRDSNEVMCEMIQMGYDCIGVNPKESRILNCPCYSAISLIPNCPAVIVVFRRSEAIPGIVKECIQNISQGVRAIWLQEGVQHAGAEAKAKRAGLRVVSDICIKKEAQKLRSHM